MKVIKEFQIFSAQSAHRRRWLARFVLCFSALIYVLHDDAQAQDVFAPVDLHIVWEKGTSRQDSEAIKAGAEKVWTKSCINLAKGMLMGQAPWGMGVFKGAACFVDGKKVAGKEKKSPWVLRYHEGEELVTLKLFNSPAKDAQQMAQLQYQSGEWATYYFYDEGFGDLVGLRILNELPVMGILKRGVLAKSLDQKTRVVHVPPTGTRLYKSVMPPEKLVVFEARKQDGVFLPSLKGQATKAQFIDPEGQSPGESTSPDAEAITRPKKGKGPGYMLVWKYDEPAQTASRAGFLAVQDERGSGMLVPELNVAINNAAIELESASQEGLLKKFLKGVKSTFASGYLGVRYGVQVLSGDPLLKKTTLMGIVAEIPLGPIEGVRYYYDLVPQRKHSTDGITSNIGYSRHIIGKAFSMKFSSVIDRFEITPKIGMWSFDAKLIDSYNDDGTAASAGAFKITKGMSFSLEAGIEWLSQNYTIRPWYSYDYANALNKVTSKKVTANRLGLDAYFRAGPTFKFLSANMRTALMGFFMYESITLATSGKTNFAEDEERQILEVSFTSGYAGTGIALSW